MTDSEWVVKVHWSPWDRPRWAWWIGHPRFGTAAGNAWSRRDAHEMAVEFQERIESENPDRDARTERGWVVLPGSWWHRRSARRILSDWWRR